jgi:L-alanine-DL-glutamate epimerase-like enolase superfamily enzyme
MKIESVEFFYLAMPDVTTAADGSQDALVVRVNAGNLVGWGECEAAPLPSIAAFVAPMSHGACQPVSAAVLGQELNNPDDIKSMAAQVDYLCMDLLQAAHTWSGIEMALWDILGKARDLPVWKLLGYEQAWPKTPYASVLFGRTAEETFSRAREIRANGFRAAKFGWAPFGDSLEGDIAHIESAREGLGDEGFLLIDAGQVFGEDDAAAALRLQAMERNRVLFFEEPFHGSAYEAYGRLSDAASTVRIAGGEAAHNRQMAQHLMDFGKVGYIQIDCGRIGGIGPAKEVADYAVQKGITYINHTFTSNLALSASLQPFAGIKDHQICEYPTTLQPLARDLTQTKIKPDEDGLIHVPDAPGLGIEIDLTELERYKVDVEIRVGGRTLYASPAP